MKVGAWLEETVRDLDAALRALKTIAEPIARAAARRVGLRSPTEDDVLDEVLVRAWMNGFAALRRVDPQCQLRSWLAATCRNAAVDLVRGQTGRRAPGAGLQASREHSLTPAERAVLRKHLAWLKGVPDSAIASLPPQQARVFRMVLAGRSGPDICRALGITKRAERNLLLRAWERLHRQFPEPPDPSPGLRLNGCGV